MRYKRATDSGTWTPLEIEQIKKRMRALSAAEQLRIIESPEQVDPDFLKAAALYGTDYFRSSLAQSPKTPPELLDILSRDEKTYIPRYVAQNPNTASTTLNYLLELGFVYLVREHPNATEEQKAAANKDISEREEAARQKILAQEQKQVERALQNQAGDLAREDGIPDEDYLSLLKTPLDSGALNTDVELLKRLLSYVKESGPDNFRHDLTAIYKQEPFFANRAKILNKYLKSSKFTQQDLRQIIAKEDTHGDSNKHQYGFTSYEDSAQKFLTDRPNLVIQLNMKHQYLASIYSKMGPEFREWYIDLAKTTIQSGHPVLPLPGYTLGWARIHSLDDNAWLINEIQEDWGVIKSTAKQLAGGDLASMTDAGGHVIDIPDDLADLLASPQHLDWLEYITGEMLYDFEKIMMRAILDLARDRGVKHIFMLPHTYQTHIRSKAKAKILYDALPQKFHFNKKKVDLESEYPGISLATYEQPDYYWYRTAHVTKNRHSY